MHPFEASESPHHEVDHRLGDPDLARGAGHAFPARRAPPPSDR
jgi:hypothetical protein